MRENYAIWLRWKRQMRQTPAGREAVAHFLGIGGETRNEAKIGIKSPLLLVNLTVLATPTETKGLSHLKLQNGGRGANRPTSTELAICKHPNLDSILALNPP
jgi:hypothetical protein